MSVWILVIIFCTIVSCFVTNVITCISCVEVVIMKRRECSWMYDKLDGHKLKPEFLKGVDEFMKYCKDHPESGNPNEVRCPCVKCKNLRLHDPNTVKVHLYGKGFIDDYHEWMCHGEGFPDPPLRPF